MAKMKLWWCHFHSESTLLACCAVPNSYDYTGYTPPRSIEPTWHYLATTASHAGVWHHTGSRQKLGNWGWANWKQLHSGLGIKLENVNETTTSECGYLKQNMKDPVKKHQKVFRGLPHLHQLLSREDDWKLLRRHLFITSASPKLPKWLPLMLSAQASPGPPATSATFPGHSYSQMAFPKPHSLSKDWGKSKNDSKGM